MLTDLGNSLWKNTACSNVSKWQNSPDLTSPEERVNVSKPETLVQLKENINREIRKVGSETLEGVMVQVLERARACEAKNGCHLSDVIFHTWCDGVAKSDLCISVSIMSFILCQNFMHLFVKLRIRKLLKVETHQWFLEHPVFSAKELLDGIGSRETSAVSLCVPGVTDPNKCCWTYRNDRNVKNKHLLLNYIV